MLIPQFTLRRLFLVVAICAVFFLFVSMAMRGNKLPLVLVTGMAAVLAGFATYAALFGCIWLLSLARPVWAGVTGRRAAENPFAANAKIGPPATTESIPAVIVDDAVNVADVSASSGASPFKPADPPAAT